MKAISVQQPWAWAIAAGLKTVENRPVAGTWRPAVDTTVALHAGRRFAESGGVHEQLVDDYRARTGLTPPLRDDHPFVYGAVIALVDVVDVHRDADCCGPYAEHSHVWDGRRVDVVHLVLANARRLPEPIPYRGQLGLFDVDLVTPTGRTAP